MNLDIHALNPPQREAVLKTDGPLMILAGAGTGKTRVISYRIAYMIQQGIDPSQIVAMTFTNKAAKEMRERVSELAGKLATKVRVGTFHSFCLGMLRDLWRKEDPDSILTLLDQGEQLDLVRRCLEEAHWEGLYKPQDLLSGISRAKNLMLLPDDLLQDNPLAATEKDLAVLAKVYHLYERQLRLNQGMDFDDCIFKFILTLRSHDAFKETLQETFKYFLVDEFQDTNLCQLEALKDMAMHTQNVCVVGDDDQSIYSWRGADPMILETFEKYFQKTTLIKLEQNYRCTNVILNAANSVIAHNQQRKAKKLWSSTRRSEDIVLASLPTEAEEAKWIAKKAFGLLGSGRKAKDMAVLYRTNSQARNIELALRELGLKYKIYGGSSFFERKEVKDFLAYLKLTLFPSDRLSFWRIINTPNRGIGLKTQEKIAALAKETELLPLRAAYQLKDSLPGPSRAQLIYLCEKMAECQEKPLTTPEQLTKRCRALIDDFELISDIRQKSKDDKTRKRKLNILDQLPQWIEQTATQMMEDGAPFDPHRLIDQLTLGNGPDTKKEDENADTISLMTIHSSKGLEYPVVFVCGLEEELLPHKNSTSAQAISEERRLFYVALTRAKTNLFLTLAKERSTGFHRTKRRESRFIKELPKEGLKRFGDPTHQSEGMIKKANLNNLSKLKRSLKDGFA